MKNIAIIGKYKNENQITDCFGKIEILSIDNEHKTSHASWQIFDENEIAVAGVTKNYFFGETKIPQEKILEMILTDIQKYKINRQKIFSEIEVK